VTEPRRGFTLVEVVIVMVVMVIVAAIAIPKYGNSLSQYRADLAARRLAADLGLAQASARASSSSRSVTFRPAENGYGISGVNDLDRAGSPYAVMLSASPYYAALGSIAFTDSNNDNQVVFDGFGVPDSGATIQVICKSARRTVTLNAATGAASVN
jgi:prepilin-type N-terminal cleavage/methylation domain-containing protein